MIAKYILELLDDRCNTLAILTNYRSLQWGRSVNDRGFWGITLWGRDPNIPLFTKIPPTYIRVWGAVNDSTGVRNRRMFTGMVNKRFYTEFDNGNSQVVVSGYGLNQYLARRVIGYPDDTPYTDKNMLSQQAMYEYVIENIGIDAVNPERTQGNGYMDGFDVVSSLTYGTVGSWERNGSNLLDVMRDIAEYADFNGTPNDFQVEEYKDANGNMSMRLTIYDGIAGTDYSVVGLDVSTGVNAAGNVPIVFAMKNDNVERMDWWVGGDEANVVRATGKRKKLIGQDCIEVTFRPEVVVEDSTRIDPRNINRWEKTVSDRNSDDPQSLATTATEWIGFLREDDLIKFQPKYRDGVIPGVDFDVGDIVSVITPTGLIVHKRVVSSNYVVDSNGDLNVTFDYNDYVF